MYISFANFTDAFPLRFKRRLTMRRAPHHIDPRQLGLYHGDALVALPTETSAFTALFDADPALQLRITDTFLGPKRTVLFGRVDRMRYQAVRPVHHPPQSNS